MSAKLIFIRRTQPEIELFGGTVYIDVDGKNVGTLGRQDVTLEVEPGKHHVKMYKSHTYDSFIGFAETEVEVRHDCGLTFRYSPPMVVSQPGHMIVNDFTSYAAIDRMVEERQTHLAQEQQRDEEQKRTKEERSKRNNILLFCLILTPFILALLYWMLQMSYLRSILR